MRAQYGMAQAFCQPLTYLHNSDMRRANRLNLLQKLTLNAFFQHRFQLKTGIKVVFNRVFRRVRNQHDFSNASSDTFVHDVLN
ncbi:Uncharacterised protein [Salmonella enterica subsp. enterica serovar Bovismorbificans]|nr:Uncharacterised protein [Salmonella enterica subsp. enterica serovar Bovismorbificans]